MQKINVEPKQCPWSTVLENRALFSQKRHQNSSFVTKCPHQKGHRFPQQCSCGTIFQKIKMVENGDFFKTATFWCPLKKGTVFATKR